MEILRRILAQLSDIFASMSPVRRFLVISAALATLVLTLSVTYFVSRTEYVPLYANLSPEEVGAIKTQLDTQAIRYELGVGGTSILVPREKLATAKVALASSGVPLTGGKGFEVFDESSLGATPFVQTVNYQRALQAELARTIGQLDPVSSARVHIVRPEQTPFVREQKPTTASVVLKLKANARLDRGTAESIVALVARAVEGLTPEHVTLVDSAGRLLSDPRPADDKATSAQLEYRRDLESYLASKAEDLLRRHLGLDRALVRVTADVNLQRIRERRETYTPDGKVPVAERVTTTKTVGAGGPRGIAGTSSNLGRTTSASGGGAGGNNSTSETIETDYLVSKSTSELENRLSNVERVTVAALVDLSGQGTAALKLTLADVEALIKQSVGFREGRDMIKVSDVRLGGEPPVEETPSDTTSAEVARLTQYVDYARTGMLVLGFLVVVAMSILVVRSLLKKRQAAPGQLPPGGSPEAPAGPEVTLDDIAAIARENPDRMVRIIQSMLGVTP